VIIKYGDSFILEQNTNPAYKGMTSFPNTTLSYSLDEEYTQDQLIHKAQELIRTRLWYTDLQFSYLLLWDIHWSFHKPDKDYNECWLYHDSILVFDLLTTDVLELTWSEQRIIVSKTSDELHDYFQSDGRNGSSYLIWQLYIQ